MGTCGSQAVGYRCTRHRPQAWQAAKLEQTLPAPSLGRTATGDMSECSAMGERLRLAGAALASPAMPRRVMATFEAEPACRLGTTGPCTEACQGPSPATAAADGMPSMLDWPCMAVKAAGPLWGAVPALLCRSRARRTLHAPRLTQRFGSRQAATPRRVGQNGIYRLLTRGRHAGLKVERGAALIPAAMWAVTGSACQGYPRLTSCGSDGQEVHWHPQDWPLHHRAFMTHMMARDDTDPERAEEYSWLHRCAGCQPVQGSGICLTATSMAACREERPLAALASRAPDLILGVDCARSTSQ